MKAALLYGVGDLRVEEVPRPVAGPGEVVIEMKASGMCGSDLHQYRRAARLTHQLRAIKSPEEIRLMRRACEITGNAFRRVLGFVQPGVSSLG